MNPLIYNAFISNGGNKYIYERQADGTLKKKSMIVETSSVPSMFPILLTWDYETGNGALNKTWQEIKDAFKSGSVPFIYEENESDSDYEVYFYQITMIGGYSPSDYCVEAIITMLEADTPHTNVYLFTTESASGYPTYISGGVE